MGPQGPTNGNAQLTRQNDLFLTLFKLVYCLTRESLKCNTLVQKICMFLQKETSHCRRARRWVPRDPSTIFLMITFTRKMVESSNSMYSSFFYARKHMISSFYLRWTEFTRNSEFFSICGSPGTRTTVHFR